MDHGHAHRPTSGASAAELVAQLREARHRTRRLTEDLSSPELMGPRLDIVNPMLWEIGHVGWFHEYWTLRHAHRPRAPDRTRRPAVGFERGGACHALAPRPAGPRRHLRYLADVLARQEELLGGTLEDGARYFYELAIRHEDMHVEALTYSRQTLSYAPPDLGEARRPAAGALPGDVAVPGGTWRLGSTASDGFVFDNEKWAHETVLPPFRIARAPVTNAEFAAFVEAGGYRAREFWSDAGWAWRQAPQRRASGLLAAQARRRLECPALSRDRGAGAASPVVFVSWFEAEAWCRWAGPTPAERSRMGGRRRRRADARRQPTGRCRAGAGHGAMRRPRPPTPISTMPSTGRSTSRPARTATALSAAVR